MKICIAAAALAAFIAVPAGADNWVATWQASPQATWAAQEFALPTGVPATLERQTVRETARISVGGQRVRVIFSNRYGTQPLLVGEAHLSLAAPAGGGTAGRRLTFGGQRSVAIPPGAPVVSDALPPADIRRAAQRRHSSGRAGGQRCS